MLGLLLGLLCVNSAWKSLRSWQINHNLNELMQKPDAKKAVCNAVVFKDLLNT